MVYIFLVTVCQNCNLEGTFSCSSAEAEDCTCQKNIRGVACDRCEDTFYDFPTCAPCQCDPYGSVNQTCDDNGQCLCKGANTGLRCRACLPGYRKVPGGESECKGSTTIFNQVGIPTKARAYHSNPHPHMKL